MITDFSLMPRDDLLAVIGASIGDLESLDGARVLVLGSSGFVGSWLCQSFATAAAELAIDVSLSVIARRPDTSAAAVRAICPTMIVETIAADVTQPLPSIGSHDIVVHAATSASAQLNSNNPGLMNSTIVLGMQHLLEVASGWASTRVVFTSSGAVYGTQPPNLSQLPENWTPKDPAGGDAYTVGKRRAESTLRNWASGSHSAVSARLFAFLGPGLPLESHFAAGNFIRDAIAGGPLIIKGDGRTVRSYQYPTDMCSWLIALAARESADFVYNVGSPTPITIAQLAEKIAGHSPGNPEIEILGEPQAVHRYVPSTSKIESEFEVANLIELDEAIERTLRWARD